MAGGASAVALLAWLGIGWMFLASYATMSPVITRLQMLEYAALPPYDDRWPTACPLRRAIAYVFAVTER